MRISDFENVFLATSDSRCREGCLRGYDAAFLAQVMDALRDILGKAFDDYIFVIDSPYFQRSPLKPSFPGKIPILFFLADETGLFCQSMAKGFAVVFRQYMQGPATSRVYPMPLGSTPLLDGRMSKEINQKRTKVFFSGCLNANRVGLYSYLMLGREIECGRFLSRVLAKVLRKLGKNDFSRKFGNSFIRFTHGFQKGLAQSSYAEKICDSRIVICPDGFVSPETIRHYEALRAGDTVITRRWPCNDLLSRAPMVAIDRWQDLGAVISGLLADTGRLEENRRKALDWWESFGSPKGFASYVAERISKDYGS